VEDAEATAFGEQSLEFGMGLAWARRRALGLGLQAEYLNGFALNTHLAIGFDPSFGGRAEGRDTRPSFGDTSLGVFRSINRETERLPALAVRADAFFPSGRHSQGVGMRLRGIASRHLDQYGRLHLNIDLNANPGAANGQRQFHPGLTLGYSRPVGLPRRFDRTVLAEVSVQGGSGRGSGPVTSLGVGFRQQVSPRAVVDLGIQSDIAGSGGSPRDRLRLIFGYSRGF
jgi:hypothetical protein